MDDSFFFLKASDLECRVMKGILQTYEKASGQAVNLAKSGIFFSLNVSMADRSRFIDLLGVHSPLNMGKYLGLPSLIGRNKRITFRHLRERIWTRLVRCCLKQGRRF